MVKNKVKMKVNMKVIVQVKVKVKVKDKVKIKCFKLVIYTSSIGTSNHIAIKLHKNDVALAIRIRLSSKCVKYDIPDHGRRSK